MSSKSKTEGGFKKGDKVKAKWSGSNAFFDAKILESLPRTYKVQFDDGTIHSVKIADVKKGKGKGREQPKRTTQSRSTSRSRSRSAGRATRSRSQSPARKEKRGRPPKAEKKSPVVAEVKKSEKSTARNNVDKDETDSPFKSILSRNKIGAKEELKSEVTVSNSYLTKELFVNVEKKEVSSGRFRASTRLANFKFAEPSSEKTIAIEKKNAVRKENAKYSDEEESSEEEIEVIKKPATPRSLQILYFLLTLIRIIVLPLTLLFLVFACTKKQCTVLEVPQFYSRWRDFGNSIKFPMLSVISFHTLLCALSLIPLGRKVTGFPSEPNKAVREYCLNGVFCLIFAILTFAAASYFEIFVNRGFDKFKSIALSSLIYCVLCSVIIHIVSLVKGNGDKQSKIPLIGNFYNGSYINPFLFGKVDVKSSFIRAGLIGSVLINLSVVLKYFMMKGIVTIPMASTVVMQTIFVLDFFIKEETMLSSATYTSDTVGYGFILTSGFLVPFGIAIQTVYLYIFEGKATSTPHYCSAAVFFLFAIGYYLYRASTNLKHAFRRNPFSPSLSGVASIPTSKKKRLISSGLWGKIRHPNYVGLFIMATAWTLPCGFSHLVPYVPLIMLGIALVVRCVRVEADCSEKYGPAWNNYTEKVPKRFIPYIF